MIIFCQSPCFGNLTPSIKGMSQNRLICHPVCQPFLEVLQQHIGRPNQNKLEGLENIAWTPLHPPETAAGACGVTWHIHTRHCAWHSTNLILSASGRDSPVLVSRSVISSSPCLDSPQHFQVFTEPGDYRHSKGWTPNHVSCPPIQRCVKIYQLEGTGKKVRPKPYNCGPFLRYAVCQCILGEAVHMYP